MHIYKTRHVRMVSNQDFFSAQQWLIVYRFNFLWTTIFIQSRNCCVSCTYTCIIQLFYTLYLYSLLLKGKKKIAPTLESPITISAQTNHLTVPMLSGIKFFSLKNRFTLLQDLSFSLYITAFPANKPCIYSFALIVQHTHTPWCKIFRKFRRSSN